MRLQLVISVTAALMMISGCTTTEIVSAGLIGCDPEEISISEKKRRFGSATWVAECKGKRHICSSFAAGNYTRQVNCKAEQE